MPPASSQPRAGGIEFTDRVFVAGRSGSGKSVLINHLAAAPRCQVVLYDTKDEFTVPGVAPVYKPQHIRWDERIIHLIDDSCDLPDVERFFALCWQRKVGRSGQAYGLVVVVHELGDLCLDQPQRTPRSVVNYVKKGRAHGLGLISGSQRPRNVPTSARTEVQHVFSFAQGFDPDDIPHMARMHRMTVPEFEHALAQAAEIDEHAYIWGNLKTRTNTIRHPLPEHLRARSIATGIDARDYRRTTTDAQPSPVTEARRGRAAAQS